MKNIITRSLSGIIYIALIVVPLLLGEDWAIGLGVLLALFASVELNHISGKFNTRTVPGVILDAAGAMLLVVLPVWRTAFLLWLTVLMLRGVYELYVNLPDSVRRLGVSALTQIYIGVPMSCITLYASDGILHLLLSIFILIWINDTGAYLTGCTWGRHRLFERISPKKSWEGFFGGLALVVAATILFGCLWSGFFGLSGVFPWVSVGLLVVVFGTWGDLMESLIKRAVHIKDSGHIIPGHGGILDRLDSALFAIPACYVFLSILRGL